MDRSRSALVALATIALVSASARVARASAPLAIYTVPTRVDLLPNDSAPTEVVIHGAFFFYKTSGQYGDPQCGYTYFRCKPGDEAMCRMQWKDVKAAIGKQYCAGFGENQMMTTATLRPEGTPITTPDAWELGIGVQPGSYVGGQCAPALKLVCPLPGGVDMAGPAPDLVTASQGDMAHAGAVDMAQPAVVDMAGGKASPDLATAPKLESSGCSTAPDSPTGASALAAASLAALLAAAALRRRRG